MLLAQDEFRESIRRINAIYRPLPWMKYSMMGGLAGVIVGFILFTAMGASQSVFGAVSGFFIVFASMIWLACVQNKITNTVRVMLATATMYENEVYKNRIPPVRWTVEEWKLVTTTVTSGRGGARSSRSSQTFFDLYVEVGQAVQPQVVVHQHMYGAPVPYGAPPAGYMPNGGYGQPPAGPYGAPPAGYMPPGAGYPPAGYPPQQWSPSQAQQYPPQPFYGQPPPQQHQPSAAQQWPSQPQAGAAPPMYNRDDPLGGEAADDGSSAISSAKLLSSTEQSDA